MTRAISDAVAVITAPRAPPVASSTNVQKNNPRCAHFMNTLPNNGQRRVGCAAAACDVSP